MQRSALLITLAGSLALACHARGRHGHVEVSVLHESEPNDGASYAEGIGAIRPGTRYRIRGSVVENQVYDAYENDWAADYFDGFAFVVDQPCELWLTLDADTPGADLDIWVYDPFAQQFIAIFEDVWNPELGAVVFPWVGEEFHVVVSSYAYDSFYTLELEAFSVAPALATAAGAAAGTDERLRPRVVVGSDEPLAAGERTKDAGRYEAYREARPAPDARRMLLVRPDGDATVITAGADAD